MIYPYKVSKVQNAEDVYWVAESKSLKGCIGQGQTDLEALRELEENEQAWLETAKECGILIPDVPIEQNGSYSGTFTVRITPKLHERAANAARDESISINQFVKTAIEEKINNQTKIVKLSSFEQHTYGAEKPITGQKMIIQSGYRFNTNPRNISNVLMVEPSLN